MRRTCLYIKAESEATWEAFKTICKANYWSYSDKMLECITPFVSLHKGGGSQTLLDSAENPKCLPKWKTCNHSKKQYSKGKIYCTQSHFWVLAERCETCKGYALEARL